MRKTLINFEPLNSFALQVTTKSVYYSDLHGELYTRLERLQTIITFLIRGLINKRFWFQYILFIVFVGGMLVLFIYLTRLASNECFVNSYSKF
jgi:NADH-ubiquinone oxidoreductase chain 6